VSPVGHLVTWSPVTGIAIYEWMRPIFGTWGINWVVGAWAILIAEVVGAWFIGPVEVFESHGPLIPSLVSNGEPQPRRPALLPRPRHILLLGAALLILAGPSFSQVTPNLPWSTHSTPLHVGCILPHPSSPGDGRPPLDRFIEESKHHNSARLLLWPEGALRFENIAQREEAINRVRNEIKGPFVGVTFTEPVPPLDEWGHSREGKWRNGLALVGTDGVVTEYYKRNLVPCTCSRHSKRLVTLTSPSSCRIILDHRIKEWS
jgi:apolipoprotein N-acyltransferase